MKDYFAVAIITLLASCAHTYPKTGNPGIDLALSNNALSHQTKMNILRQYRGEQPVFAKTNNSNTTLPNSYRPVIDPAVCSDCDYASDLRQCQGISESNTNYASNTISSAAAGAATGAILGAVLGLDVGTLAAGGATGGTIGGLGNEAIASRQMIARCMQGRGYSVLR